MITCLPAAFMESPAFEFKLCFLMAAIRHRSFMLRVSLHRPEQIYLTSCILGLSFSRLSLVFPITTTPSPNISNMPPRLKCPGCSKDTFTTNRQLLKHREKCDQDRARKVVPVKRPGAPAADVSGSSKRIHLAPRSDLTALPVASSSGSHNTVNVVFSISLLDCSNNFFFRHRSI